MVTRVTVRLPYFLNNESMKVFRFIHVVYHHLIVSITTSFKIDMSKKVHNIVNDFLSNGQCFVLFWSSDFAQISPPSSLVFLEVNHRFLKVAKNLSAVAEHYQMTGHEPDLDNIKVLSRADKLLPRKVCEAIFIKKETSPTLNRGRDVNFQKSRIHI